MSAGQILVASLTVAACVVVVYPLRRRKPREWTAEERRLIQGVGLLAGPVPTVPGRVHIAQSPLARRISHASVETATSRPGYQPRHLAVGPRDPRTEARLTTTQIMFDAVLAVAGEDPPGRHGPRELSCTRTEGWTVEELAEAGCG